MRREELMCVLQAAVEQGINGEGPMDSVAMVCDSLAELCQEWERRNTHDPEAAKEWLLARRILRHAATTIRL